jgi:Bacterial TSP3 repeat/S-layer homology domain
MHPNTKIKLYILVALLFVFGGLSSYTLSETGLLEGSFDSSFSSSIDTAEEGAAAIDLYYTDVTHYESIAIAAATDARLAYEEGDSEALATAQAEAENAASAAENDGVLAAQVYERLNELYYDFDLEDVSMDTLCDIYVSRKTNTDVKLYIRKSTCESEMATAYETYKSGTGVYTSLVQPYINTIERATSYGNHSEVLLRTTCEAYVASYYAYYPDVASCEAAMKNQYLNKYLRGLPASGRGIAYYEAQEEDDALLSSLSSSGVVLDQIEVKVMNSRNYADSANSYVLSTTSPAACTSLALSPTRYEMTASATQAAFDITAMVTASNGGLESSGPATRTTLGDAEPWIGTLVFQSNKTGSFTASDGAGNPLKINMSEAGNSTVSFKNGSAGETLSVFIEGEETACQATLTITQAAPVETPTSTTTDTDGDGLTDEEELKTYGTNYKDSDSDNDGYSDGTEITQKTNPFDSKDYPGAMEDNETDTPTDTTVEPQYTPKTAGDLIRLEYNCEDPFIDTEEDLICRMYSAGIVKGRTDITFVPNGEMTRAEWAKVLALIFGHDESEAEGLTSQCSDVSETDWFYPYMVIAEEEDAYRARDKGGYCFPNENITRGDAILYAVRMAEQRSYDYDVEGIFTDVKNNDYFAYAIYIAYDTLVDTSEEDNIPIVGGYGDGTFRPYDSISRSEAMAIAYRVSLAWGIASEDYEMDR